MKVSNERVLAARQEVKSALAYQKVLAHLPRLLAQLPIGRIAFFGEESLRADEPAIVIATHQNSHDAHVLCYSHLQITGLPLSLWGKQEVMQSKGSGDLLKLLGAFAINRDQIKSDVNREAIAKSYSRLAAGGSVGIFAETKRTYGGIIGPVSTMAMSLAEKAGVDIVTAGLYGPDRPHPFIPRPMTVYYGSRTNPSEIEDPAEFYRQQLQADYDIALQIHHGRISAPDGV